MVEKGEGIDKAFFWGTDFSTQGYMKWTLGPLFLKTDFQNITLNPALNSTFYIEEVKMRGLK